MDLSEWYKGGGGSEREKATPGTRVGNNNFWGQTCVGAAVGPPLFLCITSLSFALYFLPLLKQ